MDKTVLHEIFTQPGDLVVGVRGCEKGRHHIFITRGVLGAEKYKVLVCTQCIFRCYDDAVEEVVKILQAVVEHFSEKNPFNKRIQKQYEIVYSKQGYDFDPRSLCLTEETISWIIRELDKQQYAETWNLIKDQARVEDVYMTLFREE